MEGWDKILLYSMKHVVITWEGSHSYWSGKRSASSVSEEETEDTHRSSCGCFSFLTWRPLDSYSWEIYNSLKQDGPCLLLVISLSHSRDRCFSTYPKHVCVCVHVCVCLCIHLTACVCLCACVHVSLRASVCMCVSSYTPQMYVH